MKKNKLVRVEIIYSQAVEEDIFELFRFEKVGYHFSKINNVTGAGFSNPKLGDAIWPQLNEMAVIYCSSEESEKIIGIVHKVREHYPAEGIACFVSEAEAR